MRYAELRPNLPISSFPPKNRHQATNFKQQVSRPQIIATNAQPNNADRVALPSDDVGSSNEFSDDDIDDGDMIEAGRSFKPGDITLILIIWIARKLDFKPVEAFEAFEVEKILRPDLKRKGQNNTAGTGDHDEWEPKRLSNGKWACNHKCKDKAL